MLVFLSEEGSFRMKQIKRKRKFKVLIDCVYSHENRFMNGGGLSIAVD